MYFVLFYIHFLRDCSNQKRTQRLQEQPLCSVLEFGLDLFKGKALLPVVSDVVAARVLPSKSTIRTFSF